MTVFLTGAMAGGKCGSEYAVSTILRVLVPEPAYLCFFRRWLQSEQEMKPAGFLSLLRRKYDNRTKKIFLHLRKAWYKILPAIMFFTVQLEGGILACLNW